MRAAAGVVILSAVLVFFQLVTGGTFLIEAAGYPSVTGTGSFHQSMGYIVALVALAALVLAWVSKPAYGAMRYSLTVMFVLIFFAGGLGYDKSTILEHYLLAMLVFGVAIATTFYALRWNRMQKAPLSPLT